MSVSTILNIMMLLQSLLLLFIGMLLIGVSSGYVVIKCDPAIQQAEHKGEQ